MKTMTNAQLETLLTIVAIIGMVGASTTSVAAFGFGPLPVTVIIISIIGTASLVWGLTDSRRRHRHARTGDPR